MNAFEDKMRQGGAAALREVGRFFMKDDAVHDTLKRIADRLSEAGIAYAVIGGMALVAHGYDRTTLDVDVVVTPDGLQKAHSKLEGLGYLPPFEGSKHLRDTTTGVRIEFVVTGDFPGDGKPKPVAFPDPQESSIDIDGIRVVPLAILIELKLASGMTNPGRLRDLADVQELIRTLKLPQSYADQLDPYVRETFAQLHAAVESDPQT